MKKFFFVLAALMLLCAPASAEVTGGDCGLNGGPSVKWELNTDTGVMRVYGSGPMADYYRPYRGFSGLRLGPEVKKLVIEEGVTTVGYNAFLSDGVVEVSLPSSLEEIRYGGFNGCQFAEIELPPKVRTVADSAFANNTALKSIALNPGTKLVGSSAFEGCSSLESVTLPEGVEVLGERSFNGCGALQSIDLPKSLKSIGDSAFLDAGIRSVDIPEGCELGRAAFSYCGNLSDLTLPGSLEVIPDGCFRGTGLTELIIPDGVVFVEKEAFCHTKLERVVLPDSVATVGEYAFSFCCGLREAVLGEGIVELGDSVFSGCEALTSLTLPEGLRSVGHMFIDGTGITEIFIPKNVNSINWFAFGNAPLTAIRVDDENPYFFDDRGVLYSRTDRLLERCPARFPEDKYEILPGFALGSLCFKDCVNLKKVIFTGGVPVKAEDGDPDIAYDFTGAPIEAVEASPENPDYRCVDGVLYSRDGDRLIYYPPQKAGSEFSVPEGVSVICCHAFCGNNNLARISLPDSVSEIGLWAFQNCENLESLNIPPMVKLLPQEMLAGCPKFTGFAVPEGVEEVVSAFDRELCNLSLPQSLKRLQGYGGADALILPDGLEQLSVDGERVLLLGSSALFEKESMSLYVWEGVCLPSVISPGEPSYVVGRGVLSGTAAINGAAVSVWNVGPAQFVLESELEGCGFTFEKDGGENVTAVSLPAELDVEVSDLSDGAEYIDLWSSDVRVEKDGIRVPAITAGPQAGDVLIDLHAIAGWVNDTAV